MRTPLILLAAAALLAPIPSAGLEFTGIFQSASVSAKLLMLCIEIA